MLSVFIVGLMLMSALGVGISGTTDNEFVQDTIVESPNADVDIGEQPMSDDGTGNAVLSKMDMSLRERISDSSFSKDRAKVIILTNNVGELAKVLGKYDFSGTLGTKGGDELVTPVLDLPVSALKPVASLDSVLAMVEYPDLSLEKMNPDILGLEGGPTDIDPQAYFDSKQHMAWDAWVDGYIGTDVKVAIPQGGIDFGQPDIMGRQAREETVFTVFNKTLDVNEDNVAFVEKNILNNTLMIFRNNVRITTGFTYDAGDGTITLTSAPADTDIFNATYQYVSPYYGWPIVFDSASMSTFLNTGSVDGSWYVDTSEVQTPIITTHDIDIDTESAWENATPVLGAPVPAAQGTVQQMTVSGLDPGSNYSFAIRAFDEANLMSPLSSSPNATAMKDVTAPRMINDLTVAPGTDHATIDLTFTAVGDDMMSGTADHYIVKYSDVSITNWVCYEYIADEYTGTLDAPATAGSTQTLTLTGLPSGSEFFFAIQAVDEAGNVGMVSNTDSAIVTDDTTLPGDITDLAAAPGPSANDVYLTWTAPGDDGNNWQLTGYVVKYSTTPINASNFDAADTFAQSWIPSSPGTVEHYNLSMPGAGVVYYFAIKGVDEAGNMAASFNTASATSLASDVTPPGQITTLAVETGLDHGYTYLNFTSPGDDGLVGTATDYWVHWTTSGPIDTEAEWAAGDGTENSTVWGISFTPQEAGNQESLYMPPKWNILTDIDQVHYWAVRAVDEEGNMGPLSTGATVSALPGKDTVAPGTIWDLSATPSSQDSKITLSWTAPGDDGNTGTVKQYQIAISTSPITNATWGTDTKTTIILGQTPGFKNPANHSAGTLETYDWPNPLTKGTTYYFAIKAWDETPNIGDISNIPSSIPSDDTTPPGAIPVTAQTADQNGQVKLEWTAPADDGQNGTSGLAVKYEIRYKESVYETRYIESDKKVEGVLNTSAVNTTLYNVTEIISASGEYRVGYHPGENLAKYILGNQSAGTLEYAKVLLVDSQTPYVYDTVYVDLNNNQDFSDEKACVMGDEIAYRDDDGDGLADVSGGMIYFISQAKTLAAPDTLTLYTVDETLMANLTHQNIMNRSEEISWQGSRVKAPATVDDKNATLLHTNVASLVVYEDDSVVPAAEYTADLEAGIIRFNAAPSGNITATYDFDTNIMKYTLELKEGKITFDDAVDPVNDTITIDYQYDGLPIPYSERYSEKYGIDNVIPKNGDMVAFFGEFALDSTFGTSYASAIAGQAKMEYETVAGDFRPALGIAPNSTIVGITDPLFDGMMFATEGYDGIPGTGDEANIITTALAQAAVYETGFDLYSKYVDWLITKHSGERTAVTATAGGSGPGFGTVTSPGSAPSVITAGLATNFFYRTVDGTYDGGPHASFGDVISASGKGPTMLGTPKPDIAAAGGYFSFASNPLYYEGDGDDETLATDLWLYGHTLTAPTAAAGLALVYDAFYNSAHSVTGEIVLEATGNTTTANLEHKNVKAGYNIYKDGVLLTEGVGNDYLIDTANGILYFTEPVVEGEVITADYDYETDFPLSSEAKRILMSGADDINYDVLTQGAGYMNTSEAAKMASETSGTSVEPSTWTPGDFEGRRYEAFPNIVNSNTLNENLQQEFTVYNHDGGNNITANISAEVLRKTGESVISRNPGTADGLTGSISTIFNKSGFFDINGNQLASINSSLFNEAELLKITIYTENSTSYWLEIFDWTDTNGNGRLDQDKEFGAGDNYQGALGFGERNRWTGSFTYVNMHEAKIYNPAARSHDGIYIWNRALEGTSPDLVWYIKAEFFQKTDWGWMGLDTSTMNIAPGGTGTFTATLDKAAALASQVGTYQGGIYCEVMGKTVTIPITVNVGADNPKFEFGGENVIEVQNETVVQSYSDEYKDIRVYEEVTVESTSAGNTFFSLQNENIVNDTYITFTGNFQAVSPWEMAVDPAIPGQTTFNLTNGSLVDPTDLELMYTGPGLNVSVIEELVLERAYSGQTQFLLPHDDIINSGTRMELWYQGALTGGVRTYFGGPGAVYTVDEPSGLVTITAGAMSDGDQIWMTFQYVENTTSWITMDPGMYIDENNAVEYNNLINNGVVTLNSTLLMDGLYGGSQVKAYYTYNVADYLDPAFYTIDVASGTVTLNTTLLPSGTPAGSQINTWYTYQEMVNSYKLNNSNLHDQTYTVYKNGERISEYGFVSGEVVVNNSNIVTDEFLINATGGETTANLASGNIGPGTYKVYLNGTEMTENIDYVINLTTGEITFTLPLWPEANITADYSSFNPNIHGAFLEHGELFPGFRDINNPTGYILRLNGATTGPSTFLVNETTGWVEFTDPARNFTSGDHLTAEYYYGSYTMDLALGEISFLKALSAGDNVEIKYNYSDVDEILNPQTATLGFDGSPGTKAGDWRFFYVNIPDSGIFKDDLTKLLLKAEWGRKGTDIDLMAFGATSLNSYSARGVDAWDPDRYGPYGMTNNGGSTETATFFTASGEAREYSMPDIGAGLNIIALHTVSMNGTGNWEPFKGEVGTYQLSTDKVEIITNELSGSTEITSVSNLDLGGTMGGVAAGPSAPVSYKDQLVWQDDPDWSNYDSFEEQLSSGNTTRIVELKDCLIFDVHIYGHDDAPDLDLGVALDANGDGKAQPEEIYAIGADWDADEQVKLIGPPDGTYIIIVYGFALTAEPAHYDIDITNVQGLGFSVDGEGTDLTPDETNMWKTDGTLPAYTPSSIDLSWDLSSAKNGVTLQGALYVGPGDGAFAMLLPIELRYDDIAPVIDTTSPETGAVTRDNMPLLTAGFKDEDGSTRNYGELVGNTARLYLDGTDITDQSATSVPLIDNSESAVQGYPTGTIAWTPPGPLDDGAHVAEARIQDTAGNELVYTWSFTVDTGIPNLKLDLPEGDYYTTDSNLKLQGQTEADTDFMVVGAQVSGVEVDDEGAFTANLELSGGVNDIVIYSTDAAGNTASIKKKIVVDTEAPEFEAFRSTSGTMTNTESTTLKGKMSEMGTLTINSEKISVNSDGTFEVEFGLNEGANDFVFTFTDLAGNEANETLTVTRDTVAPQITLTSAPVVVTGEYYNFTGETEDGVILSVNGKQVPLTPGTRTSTFSRTLLLNYGPNTIVIEAKDAAGNIAEFRHVVTLEAPADTGTNWAAIGLMIVLAIVGLMIGLLVAMMIWKEGEREEISPDGAIPADAVSDYEMEPEEITDEPGAVDAPPAEEEVDENELATPSDDVTDEVPADEVPESDEVESEELPSLDEAEEPTADELSEELLSSAEEPAQETAAEPEVAAEPDVTEEVVEDERILKLKQAFEEGKISQELYEKNLARLKGQQ